MRALLEALVRFLGSFGLCVALLGVLLLLTFFGTLEQQYASIYDVQQKYFESLVLTEVRLGAGEPIPMLLPGAYLVLTALAINLVVGGLIRIRKRVATAGVIVTHVGMLLLLAAGLVEFHFSTKGTMTLAERELPGVWQTASDEFQGYFEWDLIVGAHQPDGSVVERLVPHERLEGLERGDVVRFEDPALPFDVRVSGWCRNAVVVSDEEHGIDGAALEWRAPHPKQAERNDPGLIVTLELKGGATGAAPRAVIHAAQRFPWRVALPAAAGAALFDLELRRRRWDVPFTLELEQVIGKFHPGTDRPKEYTSRVVKREEGTREPSVITMNQPLRHRGYTFFQSGYQPAGRTEDGIETPAITVLAVVRNPADAWPEIACWVIAAGLLLHLSRKLWLYAKAEALKRSAP